MGIVQSSFVVRAGQPRSVRPRSSSLAFTSSRLFWPKLVMLSRSSSVLVSSSPTVLTWARLRQLFGRSDRSRSSIGRSRSGELTVVSTTSPSSRPCGSSAHRGDEFGQCLQRGAGRRECVGGADRTIGVDLHHEAVVVGGLLDTGRLDGEGHTPDRAEDRIDRNHADRAVVVFTVRGDVAPALLDGEVDRQDGPWS